ncbi:MAG: DEAD/DEAH box helicase [Microthrixaceae bacterium]
MTETPSFADLGAPRQIVDVLAKRGITEPFPIQAAVLQDALAGRDILGRAPTGSGKTLAFGIPVVARMDKGSRRLPTALVLSPTRELAEQIAAELGPLAGAMGHRAVAIYGGVGYNPQRKALDGGASLVVACPGRLEDLLEMGALSLENVESVVVDEADRMADMGFLPAVRRIVGATDPNRHLQLFSATLEGPVAKLTRDFQQDPARHEVGSSEPDMTLAHHLFWDIDRTERVADTAQFIDAVGSTIVFTRTRHGADRLARQVGKYGIQAAPIHGGRSQSQRNRALKAFSDGKVQALIATDVAARGIHVDDVGAVVHFDPPEDAATYVHRSGRTARAGASGVVLSLVQRDQAKDNRKMQKSLGLPIGVVSPDMAEVRRIHGDSSSKSSSKSKVAGAVSQDRNPSHDRNTHDGSSAQDRSAKKHRPQNKRDGAGEHKRSESGSHEPKRRDSRPTGSGAEDEANDFRPTESKRGHRGSKSGSGGDGELTGTVVHYSRRKGFGFIKVKGRKDLFVHNSAVGTDSEAEKVLAKGNQVAFVITKGQKGPVASNVRALSPIS